MEKMIYPKQIISFLKKYVFLITAMSFIGATISFYYSTNYIQATYEASSDILVNQKGNKDEKRLDVQGNQQLVNTYSVILKSNKILDRVIDKLKLKMTNKQLKTKITVANQNNSQVITLSVQGKSPVEAANIAKTIIKEFQKNIPKMMGDNNVSVLSEASAVNNEAPIKPNIKMNIFLGTAIGLFLGTMLAFILLTLNTNVKSAEDMKDKTDISIIGQIPKEIQILQGRKTATNSRKRLLLDHNDISVIAEEFRAVRTNIEFISAKRQMQTILFTSTSSQEGKSTIVANLAGIMGTQGLNILIIDADLRKPSQNHILKQSNYLGLVDILSEGALFSEVIQKSKLNNVDIITSGAIPYNPSELLSKKEFSTLLTDLQKKYDYILIDSAPAMVVDTQIVASKADGIIMLAEENKTKLPKFNQSLELMKKTNTYIIGCILNKTKKKQTDSYYYKNK